MREIPPNTPNVSNPLSDFPWTPGQWRKLESVDDNSTDKDMQTFLDYTFEVYNTEMAQVAGLSDIKTLEPLTFRLTTALLWSDLDIQVPDAVTLNPASNQLQFWDVEPT